MYNSAKYKYFTFHVVLLLFTISAHSCQKRTWNNPADGNIDQTSWAPTELIITDASTTIDLEWKDNSLGEEGFKIDRKIGDNEWDNGYDYVEPNITTYTDTDSFPIPDYIYYRVYAYYGEIQSSYSEINYKFFLKCGDPLTDSRNRKTYKTVQIGEQCWLAENLNIGVMIDAKSEQLDNGIIEKYCYDNKEENCDIYGGLYQWNEIMRSISSNKTHGICPKGWHISSSLETVVLREFLDGEGVGGGKMKEAGTQHWKPPNTGATNSSGFSALPSGYLLQSSKPRFEGMRASFNIWTSSTSSYTNLNAYYVSLHSEDDDMYFFHYPKKNGFSVRCIKD